MGSTLYRLAWMKRSSFTGLAQFLQIVGEAPEAHEGTRQIPVFALFEHRRTIGEEHFIAKRIRRLQVAFVESMTRLRSARGQAALCDRDA